MKYMIAVAAALLLVDMGVAHPKANQSENAAGAVAVAPFARPAAAVVDAFHSALRRGDPKAALSHLKITDPEIQSLCEGIISSQTSEIDQMKAILDRK